MLLTVRLLGGELHVFRLTVNFQQPQITAHHLQIIDNPSDGLCTTYMSQGIGGQLVSADLGLATLGHLYLLTFLPSTPQTPLNRPNPPCILVVSLKATDSCNVARWELTTISNQIHPVFASLSSKTDHVQQGPKMTTKFIRLEDKTFPKVVIAIEAQPSDSTLLLVFSDGTSEVVDRIDLKPLPADGTISKAPGLAHAGFTYSQLSDPLHTALSPNQCALVTLDQHANPSLQHLALHDASPTSSDKMDHLGANFTRLCVSSMMRLGGNGPYDDALATTHYFLNEHAGAIERHASETGHHFGHIIVEDAYRALNVVLRLGSKQEQEHYSRTMLARQCMSLHLSLLKKYDRSKQPLTAKVVEIILRLRSTISLFKCLLERKEDLLKPGQWRTAAWLYLLTYATAIFQATRTRMSWVRGIVNFVADELLALADWQSMNGELDAIGLSSKRESAGRKTARPLTVLVNESASAALPILFISTARFHFRQCCEILLPLFQRIINDVQSSREMTNMEREFYRILQGPIQLHAFWAMMKELDVDFEEAWKPISADQNQRNLLERDMLLSMKIPDFLMPAISRLFGPRVEQLRKTSLDEAELCFLDMYHLNLMNDSKSVKWKNQHVYDGIQNVVLDQETEIRQCIRCGAVTEHKSPHHTASLCHLTAQRNCYCGGWWAVVHNEGTASM